MLKLVQAAYLFVAEKSENKKVFFKNEKDPLDAEYENQKFFNMQPNSVPELFFQSRNPA